MASIYDFTVRNALNKEIHLSEYRGKVLLIVNTASECSFTPQYEKLEVLHRTYFEQGLRILAFPCNQFWWQDSRSNEEIQYFCDMKFHITFPVMAKIKVNWGNADPLFKFMCSELPGIMGLKAIKWNFTKFLFDRQGRAVKRFSPNFSPESLVGDILPLLAAR